MEYLVSPLTRTIKTRQTRVLLAVPTCTIPRQLDTEERQDFPAALANLTDVYPTTASQQVNTKSEASRSLSGQSRCCCGGCSQAKWPKVSASIHPMLGKMVTAAAEASSPSLSSTAKCYINAFLTRVWILHTKSSKTNIW